MAEEQGFALTGRFVQIIRDLVRKELSRLLNPHGSRSGRHGFSAPASYLAKVPSDGIDAMEGATPSKFEAQLYHIVDDSLQALELDPVEIYHVGGRILGEGDGGTLKYVTVHQQENGAYVIQAGPVPAGACVKTLEGVLITDIDAGVPADVTHFLAHTSDGCVRRIPKSAC